MPFLSLYQKIKITDYRSVWLYENGPGNFVSPMLEGTDIKSNIFKINISLIRSC